METEDDQLLDGTADLAFLEGDKWTVIDYKTDLDPSERREQYHRQMAWYVYALSRITEKRAQGLLVTL